jgi:perosamine synthetase
MQGPKVEEFERLIAGFVGVRHAVAVNSGTSALSIAYFAAGLHAGDIALMPSHSFVATANTAVHCGVEPMFVDIDRNHYNMNPSKIAPAYEPRVRALVVVHQIGTAADMAPLMQEARKRNLTVIEDAACSLGATYGGRQTGSFGKIACLSFHPRKVITTGEGGMVLTNSEEIASCARQLRNHGLAQKKPSAPVQCETAGFNYRMTDIQAAIGIVQFHKLAEIIRLRTELARRYQQEISDIAAFRLPEWPKDSIPNYQSFVVELADEQVNRNRLVHSMNERGIEAKLGIQPIHHEPAYRRYGSDDDLPETLRAGRRSFFLPLYPGLAEEEQSFIVQALRDALDECRRA